MITVSFLDRMQGQKQAPIQGLLLALGLAHHTFAGTMMRAFEPFFESFQWKSKLWYTSINDRKKRSAIEVKELPSTRITRRVLRAYVV
jgi:hypothetical protein